jgi:hypothetical protein
VCFFFSSPLSFSFSLSFSASLFHRRASFRVFDNLRPPEPQPHPLKSGSPALANQDPTSIYIYTISLLTLSGWIIGFLALYPALRRLKTLTPCPRRMYPLNLIVPLRVLPYPLLPKHASHRSASELKHRLFAITASVMKRRLVVFAAPRATTAFLNNTNSSRS